MRIEIERRNKCWYINEIALETASRESVQSTPYTTSIAALHHLHRWMEQRLKEEEDAKQRAS